MRLKAATTTTTLLAVTTGVATAQESGLDPINNLCRRWYHQSQVRNDILYIDGGLATFANRTPPAHPAAADDQFNYTSPVVLGQNNYVLSVNLSSLETAAFPKPATQGSPDGVPKVQSGALFPGTSNDTEIYLYGGVTPDGNTSFPEWQAPTTQKYTLWGFNTENQIWNSYDISQKVPRRPSAGAYIAAPQHGLGFYLNGVVTNLSSSEELESETAPTNVGGLVILDLEKRMARNISTDNIDGGNPHVRGGMVYVAELGSMGVLVSLGGAVGVGDALQPVSMNQIALYEVEFATNLAVAANGWRSQTIRGNKIPAPRLDFCLTTASAPDNSSFNIYMHGGWDPSKKVYYDDIWALSLPSFTWIKVFEGDKPRFGHSCHLVGDRQMLSVGGMDSSIQTTGNCESQGVRFLDLTTMTWGTVFDTAKPAYLVTSQISRAIGGGPDGGATKMLPDGGWNDTLVANLFTGTTDLMAPYVPASKRNTTGSHSPWGDPGPTAKAANQPNVGAIVGGIAGGVVFLAMVAAVVCYHRGRPKPEASFAGEEEHRKPGSPTSPDQLSCSDQNSPSSPDQASCSYPNSSGTPISQTSPPPYELESGARVDELLGEQWLAELEEDGPWRRDGRRELP